MEVLLYWTSWHVAVEPCDIGCPAVNLRNATSSSQEPRSPNHDIFFFVRHSTPCRCVYCPDMYLLASLNLLAHSLRWSVLKMLWSSLLACILAHTKSLNDGFWRYIGPWHLSCLSQWICFLFCGYQFRRPDDCQVKMMHLWNINSSFYFPVSNLTSTACTQS